MSHDGSERRRYPRVPLNLLVQYRFDTFEDFLFEYADNISEGGMFIRTEEPRPEGALIYFQFALKDGTRLIEGLGRVVHSDQPATGRTGMGVEFVSFDEESRQMVKAIIDGRHAL